MVGMVEPAENRPDTDVYGRRCDIIIDPIDDFVAAHLHVVVLAALLHFYRRDILKIIFSQHCLQNDQADIILGVLHNAEKINLAVLIEVEVIDADLRVV